jgi:hypothetical protein
MTTKNQNNAEITNNAQNNDYEMPKLTEIGEASEIVLGIVGGGFDGDFGMTESQFEFEADDEQF